MSYYIFQDYLSPPINHVTNDHQDEGVMMEQYGTTNIKELIGKLY